MTLRRFKISMIAIATLTLIGAGANGVRSEVVNASAVNASALPVRTETTELIRETTTAVVASPRVTRQLWMEVTAYCPCTKCCGPAAHGVTASGLPVSHNEGRFVAADTRVLPFGAKVSIPGYHASSHVPVIDRGGAIKGQKIDVFFPTHDEALQWGRRWLMVAVAE